MSLKISSLLFHAEGVFKIFTCSKKDKLLRCIQDTRNTALRTSRIRCARRDQNWPEVKSKIRKEKDHGSHERTMTGNPNHSAPNCFKNFSELAFTLAGGFMLNDFLKFAIAFFESPFVA